MLRIDSRYFIFRSSLPLKNKLLWENYGSQSKPIGIMYNNTQLIYDLQWVFYEEYIYVSKLIIYSFVMKRIVDLVLSYLYHVWCFVIKLVIYIFYLIKWDQSYVKNIFTLAYTLYNYKSSSFLILISFKPDGVNLLEISNDSIPVVNLNSNRTCQVCTGLPADNSVYWPDPMVQYVALTRGLTMITPMARSDFLHYPAKS